MVDEPDIVEEQAPDSGAPPSVTTNGRRTVQLPLVTIVAAGVAAMVIPVWLYLGYRIIDGAINDTGVLGNIEGLLTALAVLTIPAMKIIDKVYDKWIGGDD